MIATNLDATFVRQFDPLPTAFIYGEVEREGLQWGKTMSYARLCVCPKISLARKTPS